MQRVDARVALRRVVRVLDAGAIARRRTSARAAPGSRLLGRARSRAGCADEGGHDEGDSRQRTDAQQETPNGTTDGGATLDRMPDQGADGHVGDPRIMVGV